MTRVREWPLLAGLVASLALMFASTRADTPNVPVTPVSPQKHVKRRAPLAVNVTGMSSVVRVGGIAFGVVAPGHEPKVNQPWVLTATAAQAQKQLSGQAALDVVFGGQVVGHVGMGPLRQVRRKRAHRVRVRVVQGAVGAG